MTCHQVYIACVYYATPLVIAVPAPLISEGEVEPMNTVEKTKEFLSNSRYRIKLYKFFQPLLDDLLFFGDEYESVFDRFEIFIALQHTYERVKEGFGIWGPVGRFGWKSGHGLEYSPLHKLIAEAKKRENLGLQQKQECLMSHSRILKIYPLSF